MKRIENLTLTHEELKDWVKENLGVTVQSVAPKIISSDVNLTKQSKYYYYGKLHSKDGVTTKLKTKVFSFVQGAIQPEVFFDEITTLSNNFNFIGYQLLVNS